VGSYCSSHFVKPADRVLTQHLNISKRSALSSQQIALLFFEKKIAGRVQFLARQRHGPGVGDVKLVIIGKYLSGDEEVLGAPRHPGLRLQHHRRHHERGRQAEAQDHPQKPYVSSHSLSLSPPPYVRVEELSSTAVNSNCMQMAGNQRGGLQRAGQRLHEAENRRGESRELALT
jgi:hypothetical protein